MPAGRRRGRRLRALARPALRRKVPDSGTAPTHEEFETARRRGIPILVFVKNTDEPDAPEQSEFKKFVNDYIDGRFWKTFNGPTDLNIAVGEALKALPVPGGPLRLHPLPQPLQVPWLRDTGLRPDQVDAPVPEVHLLPAPPPTTSPPPRSQPPPSPSPASSRSTGQVDDRKR